MYTVEISLLLFQEIVKLFLVMLMGFVLMRSGKLRPTDGKAVSIILVYIILPCVIIHAFQIDATPQVKEGLLFAFLVSLAIHIVFIIFSKLLQPVFGLKPVERVSMIYTNAGILIIPIITALQGTDYVIYSCAYAAVQLTLLWTHGSHTMCEKGEVHFLAIFKNINIVSIAIGTLLFLLQIKIPPLIDQTMASVGVMIGPVGMLITGMAIADTDLKEIFWRFRNYVASALRLIACPLVIIALCAVLPLTGLIHDGKAILMTVFICCITPTAAVVTSMAELYDQDASYSAELCVLSTILSIVTMPLMLFIFNEI